MNLTIEYNDAATLAALNDFLRQTNNLSPVMAEIAEHLVASATDSFRREASPDGAPWKPSRRRG